MLRSLQHASAFIGVLLLSISGFSQTKSESIQTYLTAHCSDWKLLPSDVATIEIVSESPSKAVGVSHVYVRQLVNGIPITNGLATVTLKNGRVIQVASRLKSIVNSPNSTPVLDSKQAFSFVLKQLGIESIEQPAIIESAANGQRLLFAKGNFSLDAIPVQLVYTVDELGQLQLAWNFTIQTTDHQHWWNVRASANDGTLIEQVDWINHCGFEGCSATSSSKENHIHATQLLVPPPPGADQYFVYALPVESPNHGDRSMVINPSDAVASPFGWHDDNGIMGDEYTITRGNNVYASEDVDNDDVPGYSPDGGNALDFDFPYDSLVGIQGNLDPVITNLFYMNNTMHDVWYQYGFDEGSGNFQTMNYTGDGLDNDVVFADAQDGSGTNNANFGTPPDGDSPRMQMYLWSQSNVPDLLTVNSPAAIAQSYTSSTAGFGPPVPSTPLTADFVIVIDDSGDTTDACDQIINGSELNGKIALVRRGSCTFASKVEACQAFGAIAVIVMNNTGGQPTAMGGSSTTAAIPAIMVSQTNGNTFVTTINSGQTINGTIVNPGDLTATDSDFDNMIIAHEYGHGISTRLTGGAANSDCLNNAEQMGEGWSDWFGLMMTIEPGDLAGDIRGVGTYVSNQSILGDGIRPAPYSTDFTINNFTYSATNNTGAISEPHGIGFVWATMLWDLNWALIDQYGFDPDIKNGNGGNNVAMALVVEALKLQPCGPGFVDGRDAILAADELLYAGANKCLIWEVFARRGLGFSADQGSPDSRTDQTQAFDIDPSCEAGTGIGENGLEAITVYPNPAKDVLNINLPEYKDIESIRIIDLQGKVLFETTTITSNQLSVNISAYKSGVYLVQFTAINGAKSVELVKH